MKVVSSDDQYEKFYNVEKILEARKIGKGQFEFLVKWAGYNNRHNSWEPEENFVDRSFIRKFWENRQIINNDRKKSLRSFKLNTLLNILAIFFFILGSVSTQKVNDDFWYCEQITERNMATDPFLTIESGCDTPEVEDNRILTQN